MLDGAFLVGVAEVALKKQRYDFSRPFIFGLVF